MYEDQQYIKLSKLFEDKLASANRFLEDDPDEGSHILSIPADEIDIVRQLPWLHELTVPSDVTFRRKINKKEQILFQTYFVDEHLNALGQQLIKRLTTDTQLLILLGDPGCGKTTLTNYIYKHSPELESYRKTHDVIIITCNEDFYLVSKDQKKRLNLAEFVSLQLSAALHDLALEYGCTERHIYYEMKDRAYAKALQDAMERLKAGKLNAKSELEFISSVIQGPNYNRRVLKWLAKNHKEVRIDIVIDNIDCFDRDIRNDCITKTLALCKNENTKIIFPLRYATLREYDHADAINQYGDESKVPIPGPNFSRVIVTRLQKIPNQKGLSEDEKSWASLAKSISQAISHDKVIELFNGVFGEDTREKLKAVRLLLDSRFLLAAKDYSIRSKVLKALMLAEYWIPLETFSSIHNIFGGKETPGYQNTLARIRVLQLVRMKEPYRIEKETLIPELNNVGYSERCIRSAVNFLLKKGLIYNQELAGTYELPTEVGFEDILLCTSKIGDFYLDSLLCDKTYVSIIAQACTVKAKYLRKLDNVYVHATILKMLNREKPINPFLSDVISKYGDEIFISMEQFAAFIEEEERVEEDCWQDRPPSIQITPIIKELLS